MALPENPPLPGTRVVVHSLRRHTSLNGHFGMVMDDTIDLVHGRYTLRIEGSGKVVSIKSGNFTRIKPSNEVPVGIGDDGPAFDPSKMLRGDCVMCLGEGRASRALVPCGHLCVCADCVDDVLKHRRCPVCRYFISSLLKVFMPGGTRDAEMEKAIDRAKAAEKQVAQLTERLNQKRARSIDDIPLVRLAGKRHIADDDPLWDIPLESLVCGGVLRRTGKKSKKEKKHKKVEPRTKH